MNTTIAHRQRVNVPPLPIVVLLAALIVTAAVLLLLDQPTSSTTKAGAAGVKTTAVRSAVTTASAIRTPPPQRIEQARGWTPVPVVTPVEWKALHNHRLSATLSTFR